VRCILILQLLVLSACATSPASDLTPAEVYFKCRIALYEKRWSDCISNVHPDSRSAFLYVYFLHVDIFVRLRDDWDNDLKAILDRHGVVRTSKEDSIPNSAKGYEPVQDKTLLFVDIMSLYDRYGAFNLGLFGNLSAHPLRSHGLESVEVEAWRAKGIARGPGMRVEEVHFLRENGRWYLLFE